MVHELKRQMCSKMTEWPGILAAVISDTDGVPILQAVLEPDDVDNKSNSAEPFTRFQYTSINPVIKEYLAKLDLEEFKESLLCFEDRQIMNVAQGAVNLTIIADPTCSISSIESFAKRMAPFVKDVAEATSLTIST